MSSSVFPLVSRTAAHEGQGEHGGHGIESRKRQQDRPTFNNGRKVTVTAKFATQLVAPETASAAPRIRLGNISPSSTHITGPTTSRRRRCTGWPPPDLSPRPRDVSTGLPSAPDPAVAKTSGHDAQGQRHAGRAREQQRFAARAIDERDGRDRGQDVDEAGEQIDAQGPLLRRPAAFHSTSP